MGSAEIRLKVVCPEFGEKQPLQSDKNVTLSVTLNVTLKRAGKVVCAFFFKQKPGGSPFASRHIVCRWHAVD